MKLRLLFLLVMACLAFWHPQVAEAQPTQKSDEERIKALESRVAHLNSKAHSFAGEGTVLFLFGVFCALWAQNTRRNPWLWFFLGSIFSVVTVLVLLAKNSDEKRE